MFYLALIVTSNILLDATNGADWAVISVRALFTLQTIPAALIVVARAGHKNLLSEIAKEKAESLPKVTESSKQDDVNLPVTYPADWRKLRPMLTVEQVRGIANGNTKDIAFFYKVPERTALNWIKYAQKEQK